MVSVIIACAGSGKRMKAEKNKILLEVNNKTILQYCCEKFMDCAKVDEIILVVARDEVDIIKPLVQKIIINKPIYL